METKEVIGEFETVYIINKNTREIMELRRRIGDTSLPREWLLCDGTEGTPDIVEMFRGVII